MPARRYQCCDPNSSGSHRVLMFEELLLFLKVQAEYYGPREPTERAKGLWRQVAERCAEHLKHHLEDAAAEQIELAKQRRVETQQRSRQKQRRKAS